jgi:CDP-diglyceride synthetase
MKQEKLFTENSISRRVPMFSVNKSIYIMLLAVLIIMAGMLFESWRLVLYPYMVIIGICVAIGLSKAIKRNKNFIWLPISITVIFTILFIAIDVLTLDPSSNLDTHFLGLSPSTAVLLLGVWPVVVLLSLVYSITFSSADKLEKTSPVNIKNGLNKNI